ncbi:uncharacterized protein V6R79_014171 [Siganus canaliculatus]
MFTFSLTFVRHGETLHNKEKLLQGQGVDSVLSEVGSQQGEVVGRYLRDVPFNHVFVSNLQRAVQTAELILRNSAHCSDMDMILEPLLREVSFGVAEGRPKEDLRNMAAASGLSWRDYTPPGGETFHQVKLRFKKFLKVLFSRLLEEHGWSGSDAPEGTPAAGGSADGSDADDSDAAAPGAADDGLQGVSVHALVVSHGAYIRTATRHLIEDLDCALPAGAKVSQLFSPCPNTGISRFVLTLRRSDCGPVLAAARCVFVNRKDHLQELRAAE